jgi:hypothetical protein
VLCSDGTTSQVFVFGAGGVGVIDSIAQEVDEHYMQEVEPGHMGYSRRITAIKPAAIRKLGREFSDESDPVVQIDHDGIDDAFVEKASVIHYKRSGKWLVLPGSD